MHCPSAAGDSLRVFHVITGLTDGGAEAVLYRLVSEQRDRTVGVLALTVGGVYLERLKAIGVPCLEVDMRRPTNLCAAMSEAYRFVSKAKPDVVQTWMYHADLIGSALAIAARVPRIVWGVHSASFDPQYLSLGTRSAARACAFLSHFVPDAVVCVSAYNKNVHVEYGYSERVMRVVHNGVNLSEFRQSSEWRSRSRLSLGAKRADFVVGMVARWHPVKNHAGLLHALASFGTAEGGPSLVVFVGQGMTDENQELQSAIRRSGCMQRVLCLGSRNDIPALMNAFDVVVLPSHSEAMPNVLSEAMACGTPCIASDVGMSADILGADGWVVPPGDSGAIGEALCAAVLASRDRAAWSSLRQRTRERVVSRFGVGAMAHGYESVWSSARNGLG